MKQKIQTKAPIAVLEANPRLRFGSTLEPIQYKPKALYSTVDGSEKNSRVNHGPLFGTLDQGYSFILFGL